MTNFLGNKGQNLTKCRVFRSRARLTLRLSKGTDMSFMLAKLSFVG